MAKDPVLKKKEEEEEEVEVEGKIIFFKSSSVSPSSRSPLKSLGLRHPGTLRTMRVAEMGVLRTRGRSASARSRSDRRPGRVAAKDVPPGRCHVRVNFSSSG